MDERFAIDDLIVQHLNLPDPCPIRVIVTDEFLKLYVGQRDWEWDRRSGKFSSCGTALDHPIPYVPEKTA